MWNIYIYSFAYISKLGNDLLHLTADMARRRNAIHSDLGGRQSATEKRNKILDGQW